MRVIKTKSPRELLEFLEEKTYRYVPDELWDDNLFLYHKLLKLMRLSAEDKLFEQLLMFKIFKNLEVCSIAVYEVERKTLFFVGEDITNLNELMMYLKNDNYEINYVTLNNDKIANLLIEKTNFQLNYGDKKLYKNTKSNVTLRDNIEIREITLDNASMYLEWAVEVLEEGYRYFGAFEKEELISRAGLVRLTKTRAEVIAVLTMSDLNRNKGYASFLCEYIINEGLKKSRVVTWTCVYNHHASLKTAQKIGMIQYNSIYNFKYND